MVCRVGMRRLVTLSQGVGVPAGFVALRNGDGEIIRNGDGSPYYVGA